MCVCVWMCADVAGFPNYYEQNAKEKYTQAGANNVLRHEF